MKFQNQITSLTPIQLRERNISLPVNITRFMNTWGDSLGMDNLRPDQWSICSSGGRNDRTENHLQQQLLLTRKEPKNMGYMTSVKEGSPFFFQSDKRRGQAGMQRNQPRGTWSICRASSLVGARTRPRGLREVSQGWARTWMRRGSR